MWRRLYHDRKYLSWVGELAKTDNEKTRACTASSYQLGGGGYTMSGEIPAVVTVSPSEVSITYAFDPNYERHKRTWQWLETMFREGRKDEIPPIALVQHPSGKQSLVMNGNIRAAHAASRGYNLQATIIHDQAALTDYLYREGLMLYGVSRIWFGIRDFDELVKVMEVFAAHPKFSDMPEKERIRFGRSGQGHSSYIRELDLFGPDDD